MSPPSRRPSPAGCGRFKPGDAPHLAIDGKTLRGSPDGETPAVHLLSAYAPDVEAVAAQMRVDAKTNELKAALEMLVILPIKGRLITADAIQTHRAICAAVIEGGGDYILPVKDNQPALRAHIEAAFAEPEAGLSPLQIERRAACLDRATTVDKGHGRIEKRTLELTTWLDEYLGDDWPGCRQCSACSASGVRVRRSRWKWSSGSPACHGSGPAQRRCWMQCGALGDRERAARAAGRHVEGGRQPGTQGVGAAGDGRVEELDHRLVLLLGQGEPGGGDRALQCHPEKSVELVSTPI